MKVKISLLVSCFLFLFSTLSAQQPKKVEHIHSDFIKRKPNMYEGNLVFYGQVKFKHENSTLTADTVVFYEKDNSLFAKPNVVMNIGDTVTLTCKELDYNGNTKKAFARKNVHLKDKTQTLTSDELEYDRATNIVTARGNVVFSDASQTLYTDELIYNRNQQKAFFEKRSKIVQNGNVTYANSGVYDLKTRSVKLDNNIAIDTKDYTIDSDNMEYFNHTGKTVFKGPTTITSKENPRNYVYSEDGEYFTKTEEAFLRKNSKIVNNGKILTGDNLYFNQKTGFGKGTGNVKIDDPKEKRFIKGGYGEYYQFKDSAIITQKPYAVKAFKKDSLYIAADTLIAKRNKQKQSSIQGYHKVRMFKTDYQAKCDSLIFEESIGEMYMYKDPVFWNSYRQITGDTIVTYLDTQKQIMDSVNIYSNAFAITKVDSLTVSDFHQVKGRNMHGLINNEELRYINVIGNAESIIFVDDEDQEKKTKTRIGINKSVCGIIEADFYSRQVNIIDCSINGEGKLYPESMIPANQRYLRDFVWRDKERPRKWQDIFLDVPNSEASEFNPNIDTGDFPAKKDINKKPKVSKPNKTDDLQKPNATPNLNMQKPNSR